MIKACPNCGGQNFMYGMSKKYSNVNLDIVNGEFNFIPVEGNVQEEQSILACCNCSTTFNLNDKSVINTFSKAFCKKCGNLCPEEELDENGTCIVCKCEELHPGFSESFKNYSVFDQMRIISKLMLETEQKKTKDKLDKAEKTTKKVGRKTKEQKEKERLEKEKQEQALKETALQEMKSDDGHDSEISEQAESTENNQDANVQIIDMNASDEAPAFTEEVMNDMNNFMNEPEE